MWTEAEANTKWCPEAREMAESTIEDEGGGMHAVALVAINREQAPDVRAFFPTCIGSACMMWRWLSMETLDLPERDDALRGSASPVGPWGYCGKGGRP